MRLYFVRHGESTANHADLVTGQLDVPLTELGRQQAMAAGIEVLNEKIAIDLIIASPLQRAHETAVLMSRVIGYPEDKIVVEPLVAERSFGSLQGKAKEEVGELNDETVLAAGGEREMVLRRRVEQFVASLTKYNVDTVLLVSHNGFGKRLKSVLEHGDPFEAWELPSFPNATLVDLGEI